MKGGGQITGGEISEVSIIFAIDGGFLRLKPPSLHTHMDSKVKRSNIYFYVL